MVVRLWSLVAAAVLCCAPGASRAAVLVKDGQPRATIVIGAQPSADAREAAQELQSILLRVSGATLPIVEQAGSATGTRILVGQSAARDEAARLGLSIPSGLTNAFNEEGYVVAVQGDTVVLAGNETPPYQGTAYAVYDLLHQLGCRWYMPGAFGEVLPRLSTVEVVPVRRTVRPDFRIRNIWYSGWMEYTRADSAEFALWKRRNRMSNQELVGGRYLPIPGDDTTKYLLPKERYFEQHPEYYALRADGTRDPNFMCMTNPGALEASIRTIVERFREHPEQHGFSFSPPDAPSICTCKDCTAATHGGFGGEGWGDISDVYYDFVMRVADRVAEQCPGKLITSMAYANRFRPPVRSTRRRDNLLLYIASLAQCALHSYHDDFCWSRRATAAMVRRWSEITNGLVYYEYDPHDISMMQRPCWRSDAIADDLRLLKAAGGWGFNDEGQFAWLSTGLNYYIRGRLGWNVNEDPRAMLKDFCDRFFGPASAPMLQCYAGVERAMRTSRIDRPYDEDFVAIWTRPRVDQWLALLDQAHSLAATEPYRGRVAAFRAIIDRMDLFVRARESLSRSDYRACETFAQQMIASVERLGNPALLGDDGPVHKGTGSGVGLLDFARKIGAYANGPKGRLVAALPEAQSFRTDPISEGIVMGWFRPAMPSTGWRSIRASECWYDQGVQTAEGKRYTGVAWYRATVPVPAAEAAGPLRVMVPAVKGSAVSVWCNGSFAGYLTQGRPREPRSVDITGLAKPGENLLAFRVTAEGGGGMMAPPFVYVPLVADDTQAAAR